MTWLREAAALAVAAVGLLVFALVGSASAAPSRTAHATRPPSSKTTGPIVTYKTRGPLLNAVTRTMQGDKTADGGCVWHPPTLTLGPDQQAVEARQISADFTNCTTVVEIGTPTHVDPTLPGEQVSTTPTVPTRRIQSAKRTSSYTTSQVWFKVTWYDPANVDVNHVRSIINWTWGNNTCILGYTPSSAIYAEGYTGWSNTFWSWYGLTSCESDYTYSNADFANSIFCTSSTYTHYDNVWVRGGYQGGYGGNVDSTSATGGCTYLLHWSQVLVKDY